MFSSLFEPPSLKGNDRWIYVWILNLYLQLLAEAIKKISGSLTSENDVLSVEDDDSDGLDATETNTCNGDIPEWAQVLEPVKKLPTNVGTRIRKCVYEALERNPPEWAKKILEHSISKEVYKGNASGPTKVQNL